MNLTIKIYDVEDEDLQSVLEEIAKRIDDYTSGILDNDTTWEIDSDENEEPKQMILLKDSNDNEVDYVFNIAPGDLDKALKYRDLKRDKGECDLLSDFEIIIDYLEDNDIDYNVSGFQDFEVKYY